jgi:hypothetical protein
MTAGDFMGIAQGYSTAVAIGSIDQEPIPGEILAGLVSGSAVNEIVFDGDVTAIVAGLTVWVDSVEYPFDTDWVYDGGNDWTIAQWASSSTAPPFVNTNMYFVEIK